MKNGLKILGFLCVGLGFLGVFLPILPTTPFLLLAMVLFARSSPRWNDWLLRNRLLGPYVAGYANKQGLPMRLKWITIGVLWGTMLLSIILVVDTRWVKWLLLGIAAGVTIHILMMKTRRDEGGCS